MEMEIERRRIKEDERGKKETHNVPFSGLSSAWRTLAVEGFESPLYFFTINAQALQRGGRSLLVQCVRGGVVY